MAVTDGSGVGAFALDRMDSSMPSGDRLLLQGLAMWSVSGYDLGTVNAVAPAPEKWMPYQSPSLAIMTLHPASNGPLERFVSAETEPGSRLTMFEAV